MFWYLATPYAKYPEGMDEAFELACDNAALLLSKGVPVYSPIAHCHNLKTRKCLVDTHNHDFWMTVDRPLMKAAGGIIVLLAKSWEKSRGMREEVRQFEADGKPFAWMSPGIVPQSLLNSGKAG